MNEIADHTVTVVETNTPKVNPDSIPTHVAIIMDGNGRWAKSRGLTRLEGHHAGTENLHHVVRTFADHGIKYLTLYAFSTENWSRPQKEVQGIFQILAEVIDREVEALYKENVKLRHLGTLDGLTRKLQKKIKEGINLTKNNTRMTLNLAFNYGGRADIVNAVRRVIEDGVSAQDINEVTFHRYLYTNGLPDPDLIIRTGGEMRVSNFLVWQSAYSEYYFTQTLWPDFGKQDIAKALAEYSQRERRFGGLEEQRRKGAEGQRR